jgi:hypothetical protein
LRPAERSAGEDALDHLAAGRDEQDALAPAGGVVDDGERLMVEHACSSGIGSWSWAWKRTAASSSLASSRYGRSTTRTTIF